MTRPALPTFCDRVSLLSHWRAWLCRHVSPTASTVRIRKAA